MRGGGNSTSSISELCSQTTLSIGKNTIPVWSIAAVTKEDVELLCLYIVYKEVFCIMSMFAGADPGFSKEGGGGDPANC